MTNNLELYNGCRLKIGDVPKVYDSDNQEVGYTRIYKKNLSGSLIEVPLKRLYSQDGTLNPTLFEENEFYDSRGAMITAVPQDLPTLLQNNIVLRTDETTNMTTCYDTAGHDNITIDESNRSLIMGKSIAISQVGSTIIVVDPTTISKIGEYAERIIQHKQEYYSESLNSVCITIYVNKMDEIAPDEMENFAVLLDDAIGDFNQRMESYQHDGLDVHLMDGVLGSLGNPNLSENEREFSFTSFNSFFSQYEYDVENYSEFKENILIGSDGIETPSDLLFLALQLPIVSTSYEFINERRFNSGSIMDIGVYGPFATGKTTLTLNFQAGHQARGLYDSVEATITPFKILTVADVPNPQLAIRNLSNI